MQKRLLTITSISSVMLASLVSAMAETTSMSSKRKSALENPTNENVIIRKRPSKKYYQQSVSSRQAAANNNSSTTISTSALPAKPVAPKGPNLLAVVLEFGYTSNAHDIGSELGSTDSSLDAFIDLNVNSNFAFLIETGAVKNLDAPDGTPSHASSMKNTLLGAKIVTYQDETLNTFLRAYYIAPTSEEAREELTMTSGYRFDATIQPTLYKGDVMSINFRFRPGYAHKRFDEIINRGNNLPNLENEYSIRNRLMFTFWGDLSLQLHYNFSTFENTIGTRVDDSYSWAQIIEYQATPNFYFGVGHSRGGYFYSESGSRDTVSIYSKGRSEFSGYIGLSF